MKQNNLLTNTLLLIVLMLVGFGCKSIKIPSFSGEIGESTNPKDAVTSAYKNFMDAKFYHSVVKTKNSQATVETEMDFNEPDKFWIVNKMPNMKSEVIVIGNDSYNRLNEGKWAKMPANQGMKIADLRGSITDEAFAAMKDFESVGTENLDGKNTFVYNFKSTFGGDSSSKMWISADSGLPVRVDTNGTFSGTALEMSIIYDYDKETKIEAPKVN